MAVDPAIRDHQAWLGYLQPDGLVVSPAALVDAQALLDTNPTVLQKDFLNYVKEVPVGEDTHLDIESLQRLLLEFLGWPQEFLYGLSAERPIPESLKIPLREFGETLEPSIAFGLPAKEGNETDWLLLVHELPRGMDLDKASESKIAGWSASPTRRFERLLREAQVSIGLLSNGRQLRLIYAPRGENTGTITFPISAMAEVAGRPILAAFEMLLGRYRLLAAPTAARLPALLKRSRDYQARVSSILAQQVLNSLYELLRGFQAANERRHGDLLREMLANEPDQIYAGLLTVLMRLVFLLYAEDRGLMPGSDLYIRNYALHGLYEKLRNDDELNPDTMDHRYGAWAQLTALFRVIYLGCEHPHLSVPAREGHLFDPQRYPFLEGQTLPDCQLPLVSDGTVFRVLRNLLLLDGQRLSYRTLDVEQIGSVYETMMGFRLEQTVGATIALKPAKAHGAPVPVNLEDLLAAKPGNRKKAIQDQTDYKLTTTMNTAVKDAESVDDLLVALERRIARNATPQPAPSDTMVLVPTDERRKTGSHYTPRSLTQPIVTKAFEPIFQQLGEHPEPEQILALKVCDPAMGSGAFLVEACRQLADQLVAAWNHHGYKPQIPEDEDEVLYARRLVAQRCLYGVDRNPMAVDLAKLSIWLATLAKDHPFTFLDHSLRCGDSLVGLSRRQIESFNWTSTTISTDVRRVLDERMTRVIRDRKQILGAGDDMPPASKLQKLLDADRQLNLIRRAGDAVIAAFFSESSVRARESARQRSMALFESWIKDTNKDDWKALVGQVDALGSGEKPVMPFHWEIEFPEVFESNSGGFDCIVGNPPFAGRTTISESSHEVYIDWLKLIHEGAHGNADIVAHFFRRAFTLIRQDGTFGLIATNTIGQGDTRTSGLEFICTHGATIYAAKKRLKWPGQAAVVISVVHIQIGRPSGPYNLDGHPVPLINAYLMRAGGHSSPELLAANAKKSFQGCVIVGTGFIFDDARSNDMSSPMRELHRLERANSSNRDVIYPCIGGDEVNNHPEHKHHRYVIYFSDWPLMRSEMTPNWSEASISSRKNYIRKGIVPSDYPDSVAADYPDVLRIVEEKVKPERTKKTKSWSKDKEKRAKCWWRFSRTAKDLYTAIDGRTKVLAISRVSKYCGFVFLPVDMIYTVDLIVFPLDSNGFTVLQSSIHESWVQFFASTMEDRIRYTPTDCFETFPLPQDFETEGSIAAVGRSYYDYRADLMVQHNKGLTTTYNHFHDPAEADADIQKLRELHDAMDRTVLDAYDWKDIQPECGFGLDYLDIEDDDMPPDLDVPDQLWWPTAAEALAFSARLPQSRRRLPWRYRWPEDTRDEVLARLLELNKQRAEEERHAGLTASANKTSKRKKKTAKRKKTVPKGQMTLGE